MYRIRFHGRGGQGMKTASRILGTAFFQEGFDVQDAPRYGAERRGAPMFAYVRVSRNVINERGLVHIPNLVVVADKNLIGMAAAGVLSGCTPDTILLVESSPLVDYQNILSDFDGTLLKIDLKHLTTEITNTAHLSSMWAGAAAQLFGIISKESLEASIRDELNHFGDEIVRMNLISAFAGWDLMDQYSGIVSEGADYPHIKDEPPEWIDLNYDSAYSATPAIRQADTSRNVKTGLWRTFRPVMDHSKCKKCWWNCSVFCPDSVITMNDEGFPTIDYTHCKGCLVCATECKGKAINVIPEDEALQSEKGENE